MYLVFCRCTIALLPVVFCCSVVLSGYSQPSAEWEKLRAANPPEVSLTLALSEDRPYHVGELIQAEVSFSDGRPQDHPRQDFFWSFSGLLLNPPINCGDMDRPCLGAPQPALSHLPFPPSIYSIGRSPVVPGLTMALSDLIPRLSSGRYRIAMLFRKQILRSSTPNSWSYNYADPPEIAISNSIDLEVIPATEEWLNSTVATNIAILATRASGNPPDSQVLTQNAARQIALIDYPTAWNAALSALNIPDSILLRGLELSDRPAEVCELMRKRVSIPEQSVSSSYLYSLAGICTRAALPPPPLRPPPHPDKWNAIPHPAPPDPEEQRYWQRYQQHTQSYLTAAVETLAASLPDKDAAARTTALDAILSYLTQLRLNDPNTADPSWTSTLKQQAPAIIFSEDASRWPYLLRLANGALPGDWIVPVLHKAMDQWRPGSYYEAPRSALRMLYQLSPGDAQARIIQELRRTKNWLDFRDLRLLPPEKSPFTDDELIQGLAQAQNSVDGWNAELHMAAIARYASPNAKLRVRRIYESQQPACPPLLFGYFVRNDVEYAMSVLGSAPWDMQAGPSPCASRIIARTPEVVMAPVLENFLSAHLMHAAVPVKASAASALARNGSASAKEPLWNAFRYFHRYWEGRADELAKNVEGSRFEVLLRDALAQGNGWLANEADLHRIETFCISSLCKQRTRENLESWKDLTIELPLEPWAESGGARVGQYFALDSPESFLAKLAQFPRGTRFRLTARAARAHFLLPQIRALAVRKGFVLQQSKVH